MLASDFAVCAVDRPDGQKVLRPNLGNRAFEDRGAPRPLAEFLRNLGGELHVRLLAHHPQGLLDLLVGYDTQKR